VLLVLETCWRQSLTWDREAEGLGGLEVSDKSRTGLAALVSRAECERILVDAPNDIQRSRLGQCGEPRVKPGWLRPVNW
jgi:hypothetical protein